MNWIMSQIRWVMDPMTLFPSTNWAKIWDQIEELVRLKPFQNLSKTEFLENIRSKIDWYLLYFVFFLFLSDSKCEKRMMHYPRSTQDKGPSQKRQLVCRLPYLKVEVRLSALPNGRSETPRQAPGLRSRFSLWSPKVEPELALRRFQNFARTCGATISPNQITSP